MYEPTREFHGILGSRPGFRCRYVPESNVLCFRRGEGDREALRKALIDEASFYLTGTDVDGLQHLRLYVMNPLTDAETIRKLAGRLEVLGGTTQSS